ncbi:MAG: amidohydrolase family protein [Candidatus Latescibacteria bacterium]|jgi:hypothetical protein|nr:amidohydrolase family protein [Candidatus Latescibacterota bacterium]
MTIDFLGSLGHFAFRHVPYSDTDGLMGLMDREEIDRLLVSGLECVMYRNAQKGNELLVDRIAGHRDRLIPAAVVNPAYAEAEEDAALCIDTMGMRAIRLYPNYHGYVLTDPCVRDVAAVAQEKGVPLCIAFRVEDERQRHWLLADLPAVEPADVLTLFRAFPDVHFVLERGATGQIRRMVRDASEVKNWSIETSGRFLSSPPNPGLTEIIAELGTERVLFGTDMPLQYPKVATMVIESLGLDETAREHIMGGNAARILKL